MIHAKRGCTSVGRFIYDVVWEMFSDEYSRREIETKMQKKKNIAQNTNVRFNELMNHKITYFSSEMTCEWTRFPSLDSHRSFD